MTLNRRTFIQASAAGSAAVITSDAIAETSSSNSDDEEQTGRPLFVATWPFGKLACERAVEVAEKGSMLDAIEQGIWVTEADVKNASVGIGGIPNADGNVELDACIMTGPGHRAGSVAAIQDILHPISAARKVMENSIHVMLVGSGAKQFALDHGLSETQLLTDNQKEKWEAWKKEDSKKPKMPIDENNHDTIAMVGLDAKGDLWGGCSTSGWGYKTPGRVGDSPILGSGLYVDNEVGAAGATGIGENVMRFCGSFLIVEMMRNGASPEDACQQAIERIAKLDPKPMAELSINFIALGKDGKFGAAGTSKGFKYSYAAKTATGIESDVRQARALTEKAIGPEGGNRK